MTSTLNTSPEWTSEGAFAIEYEGTVEVGAGVAVGVAAGVAVAVGVAAGVAVAVGVAAGVAVAVGVAAGVAVAVGMGPAGAGATSIMAKLNRDTKNRNKDLCRDIDISFLLARIALLGRASQLS
jgi:hypothetical protein